MIHWRCKNTISLAGPDEACGDCKPVVVIDPEDRDAVARLYDLYASAPSDVGLRGHEFLAHALREFANPKSPKPEEPTGLGAVVEAADGRRWCRDFAGQPGLSAWYCRALGARRK